MDDQQILLTLRSSLIVYFQTGIVALDTFINAFIIWISTHLISLTRHIPKINIKNILACFKKPKQENKIIISGRKIYGHGLPRIEYSKTFLAILHQIKRLDYRRSQIFQLSEIQIKSYDKHWCPEYYDDYKSENFQNNTVNGKVIKTRNRSPNLIVSQKEYFKFDNNILGKVIRYHDNCQDFDGKLARMEEFQITLISSDLSMHELKEMIESWVDEYLASLAPEKHLRYFLYAPIEGPTDEYYDTTRNYLEFIFQSTKTFDNIFFPEKNDILNRINFFTNNRNWYKSRGIPYTMGLLLHGEPGCGKSSTIKAIANHTQRHIVSVPLNKIKTFKELLNIFYNYKMNLKEINLHKRLYVLEDIDCSDLKDIVMDRSNNKIDNSKESNKETEKNPGERVFLNMLKATNVSLSNNNNKITLADLLEVLDGIMEMHGRMLIITTNYPERLDKALIRPGRLDMNIKFGRTTVDNLINMYENFFQAPPPDTFDRNSLPDKRWTPAEVTQIFINNIQHPPTGLKHLASKTPRIIPN